jgi:hypothetical protein
MHMHMYMLHMYMHMYMFMLHMYMDMVCGRPVLHVERRENENPHMTKSLSETYGCTAVVAG